MANKALVGRVILTGVAVILSVAANSILRARAQGAVPKHGVPPELRTSRTWEVVVNYPRDPCPDNPDHRYDRQLVLGEFADALNKATPGLKNYKSFKNGFYVENQRPHEFFVRDLTNPANRDIPSRGCLNLIDKHVYHFAARYFPFSLSHIAFLENGKVTLFRKVNCANSGQTINDAIGYVSKRIGERNEAEVVRRMKDYRRYGEYYTVDELEVRCEGK